jgi:hypothetical protein
MRAVQFAATRRNELTQNQTHTPPCSFIILQTSRHTLMAAANPTVDDSNFYELSLHSI